MGDNVVEQMDNLNVKDNKKVRKCVNFVCQSKGEKMNLYHCQVKLSIFDTNTKHLWLREKQKLGYEQQFVVFDIINFLVKLCFIMN